MRNRRLLLASALGAATLVVASVLSVSAASNTVPGSRIGGQSTAVTADTLKVAACAAANLSSRMSGSGTVTGSTAADLLLGSAGNDTLDARDGDDCVLGGAGDDTLIGGPGTDTCLGGPGVDTFDASCETVSDCTTPGSSTLVADRDSPVRQDRLTTNFGGTGLSLEVVSEDDDKNMRVLVGFTLPAIPAGCSLATATLRLYDAAPTGGRTSEARRVTAAWTETGVTWNTQPAVTDPPATSTSPSSAAWQTWTVTDLVRAMHSSGNPRLHAARAGGEPVVETEADLPQPGEREQPAGAGHRVVTGTPARAAGGAPPAGRRRRPPAVRQLDRDLRALSPPCRGRPVGLRDGGFNLGL